MWMAGPTMARTAKQAVCVFSYSPYQSCEAVIIISLHKWGSWGLRRLPKSQGLWITELEFILIREMSVPFPLPLRLLYLRVPCLSHPGSLYLHAFLQVASLTDATQTCLFPESTSSHLVMTHGKGRWSTGSSVLVCELHQGGVVCPQRV